MIFNCPVCGAELIFHKNKKATKKVAHMKCKSCGGKSSTVVFPIESSANCAKRFLLKDWEERVRREQS